MKATTSEKDNYRIEYYTTPRTVQRSFTTTKGVVHHKKCGHTNSYFDIK